MNEGDGEEYWSCLVLEREDVLLWP